MRKRQKDIASRWVGAAMACIVMAGVFVSCEKDEPIVFADPAIPEETPCEFEFPNNNGQLPPALVDSMYFLGGLVNPNNSDEIIFQNRIDSKVYKLNYLTGEKNVVLEEGLGFGTADWSAKDWILFTRLQNLYKVKSNGDSLTQITFNGVGWIRAWNPSGRKYTYLTSGEGGGFIRVVANFNDGVIDTLPVTINSALDWFSDSLFYWGRGSYVLGDQNLTIHLPSGPSADVAGISAIESLHLKDGLVLLNRQTGDWEHIQTFSSCYNYYTLDYSPQKGKLLASRLYQKVMPDGMTVYRRGEIVWLNLDGTLHEVIGIAQFMNE